MKKRLTQKTESSAVLNLLSTCQSIDNCSILSNSHIDCNHWVESSGTHSYYCYSLTLINWWSEVTGYHSEHLRYLLTVFSLIQMASKTRSTTIQRLIEKRWHIWIFNSDTLMWKASLTLHQCLRSCFHDCVFISTYEKCILTCSIFLKKFNSQQNVQYLRHIEVNTIVISRDSLTSSVKSYSFFKQ